MLGKWKLRHQRQLNETSVPTESKTHNVILHIPYEMAKFFLAFYDGSLNI